MRILVAGIGNIFLGDDAFGVEVVRRLADRALPEGVRVVDFGIRSYDLAYALMEDYDAAVLVDATQQDGAPGTLYLIDPDPGAAGTADGAVVNAHSMNPVRVLHLVRMLGGETGRLFVVGCEPAVLETDDGYIGLSATVEASVPGALAMILALINDLLRQDRTIEPGRATAQHSETR